MNLPRCLLIPAAALALSLGACGETMLDTANVEDEVAPQLEKDTGTKGVEISCPDDIEAKKGETFECDATAEGGLEQKLKITQEDDEGNVTWEPVEP